MIRDRCFGISKKPKLSGGIRPKSRNIKVMVIAPHPDDDVLGCGGVMARHAACGDEVSVLVMTKGAPEVFPPDQVEQIRSELLDAHCVLGVSGATFLDFPAPKLDTIPGYKLAESISQILKTVRPQLIYLPHGGDLHTDHQAVYLAGLVAARPINGCSVKKVLCYETMSETEWGPPVCDSAFTPTVFVDIRDHLDTKIEALRRIGSQIYPSPHSRSLEAIEALARLRGSTAGLPAAEAFTLVREVE